MPATVHSSLKSLWFKHNTEGLLWRYLAVSVIGYLVHVLAFNLLVLVFGFGVYVAQLFAGGVNVTTTYVLHLRWTFRSPQQSASVAVSSLTFLMGVLFVLPIPLVAIWFSEGVLGLHGLFWANMFGNGVGVAISFVVRYFFNRYWVFGGRRGSL